MGSTSAQRWRVPIGRKVPQWIGTTMRGANSATARAALSRVEVAGAERRAPAPDRQQRDVERRVGELGHPGEQLGVAREVDPLLGPSMR